jgi:hypothetical protein
MTFYSFENPSPPLKPDSDAFGQGFLSENYPSRRLNATLDIKLPLEHSKSGSGDQSAKADFSEMRTIGN